MAWLSRPVGDGTGKGEAKDHPSEHAALGSVAAAAPPVPAGRFSAPGRDASETSEEPGTTLTALEASTSPDSPQGGGEQAGSTTGKRKARLFLRQDELSKLIQLAPDGQSKSRLDPNAVLAESLRTPAADRAASPLSPAVSAGYHAAPLAAESGTAVLEVRADAEGRVTGVRVLGRGQDASWAKVADELLRRLQGSRLRMREGAAGLVARLRIERGKFTRAPGTMKKLKAGAAIGQESRSFAQEQARAELDQRNRREGITPGLDVSPLWRHAASETRISVVGLTFL